MDLELYDMALVTLSNLCPVVLIATVSPSLFWVRGLTLRCCARQEARRKFEDEVELAIAGPGGTPTIDGAAVGAGGGAVAMQQ